VYTLETEAKIMSHGLNKAFLNDPKGFMRSHVIEMIWGYLPNRDNQQIFIRDFDFVPIGNGADGTPRCRLESYTRDQLGHAKAHGAASHPIHAYWLPYTANRYCETTLGNAANYMFTATLTGCTIAVGSGSTPKVSHINHQVNAGIDHPSILKKYHKHYMHDVFARAIHQDDYWLQVASGREFHTLVGIRHNQEWKFYLNSRESHWGVRLLQGCRKMHRT
jgi:hypothetical protein